MPRTEMLAAAFGAALAVAGPAMQAAAQESRTTSGFQLGGEEPIEIESDRLEVRDKDHVAVFSGNVRLVQGKLLVKTTRMTAYYSDNGKAEGAAAGATQVDHMEAEGKVYIKQGDQVATGDQGSFDMKSGVLVLTGKEVVLTQGDNVIVGCKLVSNNKTGLSQLDGCGKSGDSGRVKMLLQPGSQGN